MRTKLSSIKHITRRIWMDDDRAKVPSDFKREDEFDGLDYTRKCVGTPSR